METLLSILKRFCERSSGGIDDSPRYGPIVAFFDVSDNYHARCIEILKDLDEELLTTWAVLTEAFYLLGFSWKAQWI